MHLFECAFAWSSNHLGLKVRYGNRHILSRWVNIACRLHYARNFRCRSYSLLDLPRKFPGSFPNWLYRGVFAYLVFACFSSPWATLGIRVQQILRLKSNLSKVLNDRE